MRGMRRRLLALESLVDLTMWQSPRSSFSFKLTSATFSQSDFQTENWSKVQFTLEMKTVKEDLCFSVSASTNSRALKRNLQGIISHSFILYLSILPTFSLYQSHYQYTRRLFHLNLHFHHFRKSHLFPPLPYASVWSSDHLHPFPLSVTQQHRGMLEGHCVCTPSPTTPLFSIQQLDLTGTSVPISRDGVKLTGADRHGELETL